MYVVSIALTIFSNLLYHTTQRAIRPDANPLISLAVTYVVALIFSVIGSLQLFNEPQVLHPVTPDTLPYNFTPNMYAYNLSFGGQEYNYSAAIAIVMGIITMIIAAAVQRYGQRRAGDTA